MIVFLTLIYVGLLFLLVKLNIIKLNLFWKLSPAVWMLGLFLILFIPLQWGAPTGNANVYQMVVEIIPNVAGEVVEVSAEGMQPMKKGDELFRLDPEPFQIQLNAATAGLADAEQKVKQLIIAADAADTVVRKTEQEVDVLKAEQQNALAAVFVAEATVREAEAGKEAADSMVADLQYQVETAQKEVARLDLLLSSSAVSQSEVDRLQVQYTGLTSKLDTATINARSLNEVIARSKAGVEVAITNVAQNWKFVNDNLSNQN